MEPEAREPAKTGIDSSDHPLHKKARRSKVPMRLFEDCLEANDEGNDDEMEHDHDMEHDDEMEPPGTPHDTGDEPTVDGQETFPGAARVKSTGSLDVAFLVDHACVPMKIQKIAGIF
jgi:hypothetical protein